MPDTCPRRAKPRQPFAMCTDKAMVRVCLTVGVVVVAGLGSGAPASAAADNGPLSGHAASLYRQAKETGRFFDQAQRLHPEVRPTSDGQSFSLIWKSAPSPRRWIVSLHGAGHPAKGFATDDLAIWHRHLAGREVGLVSLQWWMGTGSEAKDFYTPLDMYREIDLVLQHVQAQPGDVLLHGFSRGSANTYAVAAIDAGQGRHYFALIVANSGSVALDYPPNRDLLRGAYGQRPLRDTHWITVAGGKDPQPEQSGIPAMRRTASWLREQGATIDEAIEDPNGGHGALHLDPRNCRLVLDRFLRPTAGR